MRFLKKMELDIMKRLDMAYGNPAFLQEGRGVDANSYHISYNRTQMPYEFAKSTTTGLEENIKELHRQQKNALITNKTQIVITVGAVQAISAALYAYNKAYESNRVYVPKPYWGRFNELIDQTPYRKRQIEPMKGDIKLITSPNNPDGADTSNQKADIRDACYNWSHYTKNVVNFKDPIVIYSMSKLTGHSSTRIGWAVVQDETLANYMREYVEIFSSGVSIQSQDHANYIIPRLTRDWNNWFFRHYGKVLQKRLTAIRKIVKTKKLPVKILSKQGMFLYIECRISFILGLNIKCIEGAYFGDSFVLSKDCTAIHRYRLNIGIKTDQFEDFLERLNNIKTK